MRAIFAILLLLGGCQKNFDDQYDDTEEKVKALEARIDAEMAEEAAKEPGPRTNNK